MSCYLPLVHRWRKPGLRRDVPVDMDAKKSMAAHDPSVIEVTDCEVWVRDTNVYQQDSLLADRDQFVRSTTSGLSVENVPRDPARATNSNGIHAMRDQSGITLSQGLGDFPHDVQLNIRHDHPTLGLGDVAYQRLHQGHTRQLQREARQRPEAPRDANGVVSLGLPLGISSLKLSSRSGRKGEKKSRGKRSLLMRAKGYLSEGEAGATTLDDDDDDEADDRRGTLSGRDPANRGRINASLANSGGGYPVSSSGDTPRRHNTNNAGRAKTQPARPPPAEMRKGSLPRKTKIPSVGYVSRGPGDSMRHHEVLLVAAARRPRSVDAELLLDYRINDASQFNGSEDVEFQASVGGGGQTPDGLKGRAAGGTEISASKFAQLTSTRDYMAAAGPHDLHATNAGEERSSSGNSSGSDLTSEGSSGGGARPIDAQDKSQADGGRFEDLDGVDDQQGFQQKPAYNHPHHGYHHHHVDNKRQSQQPTHTLVRGRGNNELLLVANRGPPPRHLLPDRLRPSPLQKLHPAIVLPPHILQELEPQQTTSRQTAQPQPPPYVLPPRPRHKEHVSQRASARVNGPDRDLRASASENQRRSAHHYQQKQLLTEDSSSEAEMASLTHHHHQNQYHAHNMPTPRHRHPQQQQEARQRQPSRSCSPPQTDEGRALSPFGRSRHTTPHNSQRVATGAQRHHRHQQQGRHKQMLQSADNSKEFSTTNGRSVGHSTADCRKVGTVMDNSSSTPSPLDLGYQTLEHSYDGEGSMFSTSSEGSSLTAPGHENGPNGYIPPNVQPSRQENALPSQNVSQKKDGGKVVPPSHVEVKHERLRDKESTENRLARLEPGVTARSVRRGEILSVCHLTRLAGSPAVYHLLGYLAGEDLVRLAATCRTMYNLVWTSDAWTSIRLVEAGTDADRALRSILSRLVWCESVQGGRGAPGVTAANLGGAGRLTDRSLALLARNCPQLEQLELRRCRNVTNGGILDLMTRCNKLSYLDITGCQMVSSINLGRRPEYPPLTYLDMSELTSLDDAGLQMVVISCPNLTHLYLRKCVNITDVGVKSISSYCPRMKELSLSDCPGVSDGGLSELARLGPSLRYLSVAKCSAISDNGVRVLSQHCYKLRYLNLRGCVSVTDNTLVHLTYNCKKLRSLDVGKCSISDSGLTHLASRLPNLRKLSVRGCESIGGPGLRTVAQLCRGLIHLNVMDCPGVDANVLSALCADLTERRCYLEHTVDEDEPVSHEALL